MDFEAGPPTDLSMASGFGMPSINGENGLHLHNQPQSAVSWDIREDFTTLIKDIADGLNSKDLDTLRYCYRTELGSYKGEQLTALAMLARLEEKGKYSQVNIFPLESMLKKIDRCDLVSALVDPFKERHKENIHCAVVQRSHSMPAVNQYYSPSTPQRRVSHPTPPPTTRYPHPSHPSHPPSLQSLTSIPEDPQQAGTTSILVSGRFTHSWNKPHPVNLDAQKKNPAHENISLTQPSPKHHLPTSSTEANPDHRWTSMQQASNARSAVRESSFVDKFATSVESTQFSLETPPTEVRSKVTTNVTAFTTSIREHQEQERSLTPLPLKTPQTVENSSTENSMVLVPGTTSTAPSYISGSQRGASNQPHPQDGGRGHRNADMQAFNSTGAYSSFHSTSEHKYHTRQPHIFKVKRKRICALISELSSKRCAKSTELVIPVKCCRAHGPKVAMEIHSFGNSTNDKYVTLKSHITFVTRCQKCRDLVENCKCLVTLNVAAFELPSKKEVGKSCCSIELDKTSDRNDLSILLVPHEEIIYKTKDINCIQFEVTAMLTCKELIEAIPMEGDGDFLFVRRTGS